jgi:uncharacterized protein YlzI (FlbEa/FlbD family)
MISVSRLNGCGKIKNLDGLERQACNPNSLLDELGMSK